MNTIETVTRSLASELGLNFQSFTVYTEGSLLTLKLKDASICISNWQSTPISQIVETAKSLTLKESFTNKVLLNG